MLEKAKEALRILSGIPWDRIEQLSSESQHPGPAALAEIEAAEAERALRQGMADRLRNDLCDEARRADDERARCLRIVLQCGREYGGSPEGPNRPEEVGAFEALAEAARRIESGDG